MPYISRNEKGKIVTLHKSSTDDGQWVDKSDPEFLEFLKNLEKGQARNALTSTDQEMVRVVEDLIDLLMKKQIFIFTELPNAVQLKLNERRQLRKDINSLGTLINEDDDAIF